MHWIKRHRMFGTSNFLFKSPAKQFFYLGFSTKFTLFLTITWQKAYQAMFCWRSQHLETSYSCWGRPRIKSLQVHLKPVKMALDCSWCKKLWYMAYALNWHKKTTRGPQLLWIYLHCSLHQWAVENFNIEFMLKL